MKIDLDGLGAIARAADKDNPGSCYIADRHDGYPSARSAMDLFNAMGPATTLSLIRRLHELEELGLLGIAAMEGLHNATSFGPPPAHIARAKALLAKGAKLYGSIDPGTSIDPWTIVEWRDACARSSRSPARRPPDLTAADRTGR
jgi:hypothetical protein